MGQASVAAPERRSPNLLFGAAALAGALVAVAAGVYGRLHDPASETTIKWFFTSTLHLKAWFATVALLLAVLQLLGGLWMFGKLPFGAAPSWVGPAHRITGSLVLLVSLPVAYHCLWSLGFNPDPGGGRRLVHSILGCAFYGAFATKLLALRIPNLPGWGLPFIGGLLVTSLTFVWLTSSLWFFTNVGFPGLES